MVTSVTTSTSARSWPTTSRCAGHLPVDRGPADEPRRPRVAMAASRPWPRPAMLARHRRPGFPATVVRPAAIYGPDNNIFDMELPMFLRLLGHRPILVPHGGLVVGSYGHVDDLCEAMVAMVGNPAAIGEVFNITGESVTVNRYIEVLADVVGEEPDVVYVPDAMLRRPARPGVRPPVRCPPPRDGEHREGAAAARVHVPVRPALGTRRTRTSGSAARGTPTSTGRWSTRCGERRGTSRPRPRSPSGCAVA